MSTALIFGQVTLQSGLGAPYDVVADASGNLYIADSSNKRILKTKADGTDRVVLKNFDRNIFGLVISDNKLFVSLMNEIFKMNLDGTDLESVTSTQNAFYITSGNDGYIYFTNPEGGKIQRVKEDGSNFSTVVENLYSPIGITYDTSSKMLIFSEKGTKTVRKIKKDGTGNQVVASSFNNAHNIRTDASGNIYVANTGTNQIIKISNNGTVYNFTNTSFFAPTSTFVTIDGRILVADTWGGKISYLNPLPANYLKFNGANNYISGTNATLPQGNAERTIEAVIKAPSIRTNPSVAASIFNYGSYTNSKRFCLMLSGGRLSFVGENNDLYGTTDLRDDKWHHVAVTLKGNTVKLYIDGVLELSAVRPGLMTTGNSFQIGASNRTVVDEFFEGGIDEVRVWNRALSAFELQNNLTCELANPATQNGLVAYYQFNQGFNEANNSNVSSAIDTTGNSTGNLLNNFILSGTSSNFMDGSHINTGNICPVYVPFVNCTTVTLPHGEMAANYPTISWTAVANAEIYKIYVGTAPGSYDVLNGAVTPATTYELGNLADFTKYYVKIVPANSDIDAAGCIESSFTTGTVLGVSTSEKTHVSVYPNPVTNLLFINSTENILGYTIYGGDGRLVKNNSKASTKQIDVSTLSAGIYSVKIKTQNGEQSFRIIKR